MAGEQQLIIRVISQNKDFCELRDEWNNLAKRINAGVFQTHEWQYSWWHQFGKKCKLHIITFRKSGRLVAIFPFYIDCSKFLGVPVCKSLKLIGSIISNLKDGALPLTMSFGGYLDALIDPDYYEDCRHAFTQWINDNDTPVNHILLDELPPQSLLAKMFTSSSKTISSRVKAEKASTCYQILLPDSWDEYLGTLSKNSRKKAKRGLREVTEKKTFDVRRAQTLNEFERLLHRLIELHEQRWKNKGEPGFFADKRVEQFYLKVCRELFNVDKAVINYCVSGEEIFAVELEFRYNNIIYAMQGGFDEHSVYSKYSPSKILFYHSIKEGIENGYRVYDWLRGAAKYKLSLSNNKIANKKIVYSSSGFQFGPSELTDSFKRRLQHEKRVLQTLSEKENGSLIKTARAYAISVKSHFKP